MTNENAFMKSLFHWTEKNSSQQLYSFFNNFLLAVRSLSVKKMSTEKNLRHMIWREEKKKGIVIQKIWQFYVNLIFYLIGE